ncbi:uncharacterized protein LOC119672886 [Teleopsis dalmanni]|uniref:uncharacterized protein LOC119672886 n=1 Tax=Teleopsis dalmanni TaxID=139649 RepID=UPI0018CE5633|nr:uncharacterized protein LOC119672886 [Teleopsis dalmanni]
MKSNDKCPRERMLSEFQDEYRRIPFIPPPPTRLNTLKRFMWDILLDEYMISCAEAVAPILVKDESEYYDRFCSHITFPFEEAQRAYLKRKYPLYSTRAITCYNKSGDPRQEFKRRSTVTVPVQLQNEQFG